MTVLLACTSFSQAALGQAPPPGVFAEARNAIVALPGPALEPTTMRSRVVQVDTRKIAAARRGREVLKLNLFDDTVVEVNIRKTRPTRSGHFIFGIPRGMDWGEVRLVVNGPVMVGTVVTPKGEFTIRSTRAGHHVIRQVDPTIPFECGVDEITAPGRPELPAVSSIGPAPAGASASPVVHTEETPTEDGSEVRVLVVYTPALQAEQGGAAGMRAMVDLMIQSANQAFEEGGISPRLVLAHTAMVDYVSAGSNSDVSRLISKDDGYLDEVHALRNRYAADLVHLLTNVVVRAAGSASRPTRETLFAAEHSAFGATGNGSELTFTHEIGHNFGLRHDRYVNTPSFTVYPYAFGYTNQAAFKTGAPATARWRTVMSYGNQCSNANFGCARLLRFSNPEQTYLGDPMGVAADVAATGTDGPADARLTINNMGRWVGSFRSEACTEFRVSPGTQIAPRDGGDLVFRVTAGPGCLWEASSQSGFLSIVSGARSAGNGHVRVRVEENGSGAARNGNLTVAGYSIPVRQLATEAGICGRSPAVAQEIAREAGYSGSSQCEQVSEADLAGITTLSVAGKNLFSLKADDFAGLSGLTRLSVNSNELSELPHGVFSDLVNLTRLNLGYNELTELPAGLFAGLASLEELDMESNRLITLPDGLFADLANLKQLEMDYNDLVRLPEGLFAGLSGLELISMYSSALEELPAGLFSGLSNLKELNLGQNELTELPAAAFADLSSIEILNLFSNELAALPAGLFDGLSSLKRLDLGQGKFVALPEGLFSDLSRLEVLNLWDSRLARLSPGGFAGLSGLRELNLYSSRLTELPSGAFAGLSKLEQLNLGGNEIGGLPGDVFSGLGALRQLNLFRNRLTSLPDGIFSGLNALETLHLGANLLDPLPLPLSLEKVGDNSFKAVVPTGAPFALELPVSVGSSGEIEDGAGSVSIPAGALESAALAVTRVAGTADAVEVEFGALPGLPAGHTGYAFVEDESLPRRILASSLANDAALSGISVSGGTLNPVFSPETLEYTALLPNGDSSVSVFPVKSNADATVAWLDGGDQPLADADPGADGQQVNLSVGENTIKVQVTAADGATRRTYTLTITRDSATDVCSRTPQVRDAILAASGVDNCSDVTAADLAGIARISIFGEKSLSLKSGDFSGLTALRDLGLRNNGLNELPADLFRELAALEELYLNENQISRLPDGVFSGLPAIEKLFLTRNRLTELPSDIFSGLSELEWLGLSQNQFTVLPADVFTGLTALERLNLSHNQLSFPSTEIFSGLTALESLWLHRNQLRSVPGDLFSGLSNLRALFLSQNRLTGLPSGIFSGLTMLETLHLEVNAVNPMPIPLSIEKVGENQIKIVLPTAAPYALEMPVLVNGAGEIEGGATAATIPGGATESAPLTVARVSGTTDPVTADLGTAPDLPSGHKGYFFERDATLPREVLASPEPARDAALRRLSVSVGTLDPAFASGTTSYTVRVANATASVTLTGETSNPGASVSFLDANDQALADADTTLAGHQVNLNAGGNTIRLRVTSEDSSTTRTYAIVVTRNTLPEITTTSPLSVSENQTAVATLAATDAESDAITWLTNGGADSGRFDLTADGVLTFASAPDYEAPDDLDGNNEYLVTVEASDGTDSSYLALAVTVTDADESAPSTDATLTALTLSDGTLSPAFASGTVNYTAGVAANVAAITVTPTTSDSNAAPEYLDGDDRTLDDADASTDGQQVNLEVGENTIKVRITAADATTTQTYTIVVTRASAPTTSQGVCDRTGQVGDAIVAAVSEADACADVTAQHLAGITRLDVSGAAVGSLKSGDFAGLTALEFLKLSSNNLTALPAGIFSGLGALETLELDGNRLSGLPDGVFSGLESLTSLKLGGNTVDPLPLSVTLEKAGGSGFRAVTATGAPFRLALPVSAGSAGRIADGATSVTIETGRDRSASLEVTRVAGTEAAVTVDIGTLPGLPADHSGYALRKAAALPLEILAAVPARSEDATLSGLSLSAGTLDPAFASGTTSYAATVGNAVTSITVTPTKSNTEANVEYHDENDSALADADDDAEGHQVDLSEGENTIKVKVTAEDGDATRTYTLAVTRNRAPQITTASPISVAEENTFVADLQATDADGHALTWYVVAGEDRERFELTDEGELSFQSAPDFENPADSDENNEYRIVVGVTDRIDSRQLTLTVNVTDVDERAPSSDAGLTGLAVSGATLSPAFGSGTTSYTATVGNGVSSVTVTPTRSDGGATLEYLDANDSEMDDGDGNASGHQVDLSEGANTIKVKVTAEDGDATRTYTVVVTRNRVPRITTASPISVDENDTAVATLAAADADGDDLSWSKSGGVDQARFDLTAQGVLTFVTAPDYESPEDADANNDYVVTVRVSDGTDASDLTLTVNVTDVDEAPSSDATLSGLTLSDGTLDPVFAPGTTKYTAAVGSSVSSITLTPTKGDDSATVEYLDVRDETLDDAGSGTEGRQVNLAIGKNTIRVKVTAGDTTTTQTYELVVTRGSATGVCARTEQVRDAIVARISGVDACEDVTAAQLSGIASLSITGQNIQTLQSSDFAGLTGLTLLSLSFNDLAGLPADVFSGLTALESLDLVDNDISNLPAGVFSGLSALEVLLLGDNDLGNLPAGVFSGLSALEELELDSCELRSLPADVFSGLGSLQSLVLSHNELSSLPAGVFSGLAALTELKLNGNTVNPLPVSVSLEKVGESQFKAVAPTGAPFRLDLPVSAGGDGRIQGDADSLAVPTGAVESSALTVTRRSGTTGAVTADIGTLPGLPANHSGYVLEKDSSLPLEVLPAPPGSDATLSGLTLSDGTLDPVFASGTTSYTATVASTVSSITLTPAKGDDGAAVEYLDVRDETLDDAESGTEGQQVSLSIGRNTIKVQVTAEDTTTARTYEIVVTRGSATGVCARTEQVRDEIVDTVSGVDACEDVTEAQLAGITQLDLISANISSLRTGDFAGLTGLEILYIFNNRLKSLPTGIFSGLTELAVIEMSINELGSLDAQVFSGLTNLELLDLYDNEIASLPSGIFSGLTSLESLALNNNALTELPSGIFSGLTALTDLTLRGNKFTSLDANLFSGLTALESLWLDRNQLSSLPANLFSGLTRLEQLLLSENRLSDLPAGVFSDLDALEWLWLHGNSLTSLPSGIFSGLDGLARLKLEGNSVDPLPLTVSLEKVGSSQFKAVAPVGAPFALELPVTVSSDGAIDGDAGSVTVAAGGTESGAVGVTRVSGTTGAVTANIGALPGLPANHSGYALQKDDSLPLEVLAEQSGAPGEGIAADASFADVNGNGLIEADDAMIIFHAIESAGGLGDGETGGTPAARATLLAGLAGAADRTDDELRAMLRKANQWRDVGVEAGGDMNGDGRIDGNDSMIMYYAYAFEDLVGNGESGGAARFRRSLLADLAARPDPGDSDLKALLRNAHALRVQALAP